MTPSDFAEVKSEAINSALLKKGDEVEGMYSKIGFVYWSIHAGFNGPDYTCSAPSSIYGEAVNRCFAGNGFSYKFQIVESESLYNFTYRNVLKPHH